MPDATPVGGLQWVKGEIAANLRRVRAWLEALVEGGGLSEDGAEAVTALSEVRGVLAALQIPGAARLAEEMQALCEQLASGETGNVQEAGEALMLALIQLPDYLDRLQAGLPDTPASVLGAINDLRTSRRAPALSEAEVLLPASILVDSELPPPELKESLGRISAKIRPHFHRALLQWFRPESARQGLMSLGRLFHQLQLYVHDSVFHDLFLAAEAVVEGLLEGGIAAEGSTKALIGRLDRIIKPFAEDPEAWPEREAHSLLRDLLSLVARSQTDSHLIQELRRTYGLGRGPTPGEGQPGPGSEALAMLAAEARRELVPIKDLLDLYARGTREDPRPLGELGGKLRSLANTLAIAGMDDLVARLQRCSEDCVALAESPALTDERRLTSAAEELIAVEATLADLAVGGGFAPADELGTRELLAATLKEVRVDMTRAEQAIAELAAGAGNPRLLAEVPELFHRIAGALRVLAENDAADVLDTVVTQTRKRLIPGGRAPTPHELELLANAVSGVELYLEALAEGERFRPNLIADARAAADELAGLSAGASGRTLELVPPSPPPAPASEAPEPAEELAGASDREQTASAGVTPIDPEFLEIFLEEAGEEEQTIRDQFARWSRDEGDRDALTRLRRSFHTLKGSGRLVGAERVGELARAVEALLNRVLDGSVERSAPLMDFLAGAVAFTPQLITAEANGSPLDIAAMVARAESLAVGAPAVAEARPSASAVGAKVIPWPGVPTLPEVERAAEPTTKVEGEYDAAVAVEMAALADANEDLLSIFRAEAQEHFATLRNFVEQAAAHSEGLIPDDAVVRALHTLTGSARMTGVDSTARATAALERLFGAYRDAGAASEPAALGLLAETVTAARLRLDHLPGIGSEVADLRRLADAASVLLDRFLAGVEIPPTEAVAVASESPAGEEVAAGAEWELLPLGEEVVGLPPPWEAEGLDLTWEVGPAEGPAPIERSTAAAPSPEELGALEPPSLPPVEREEALPRGEEAAISLGEPMVAIGEAELRAEAPTAAAVADDLAPLPPEPELIALFLEDARDILDKLDQEMRGLQRTPTEAAPLEALQRLLHTLKGSARLTGLSPIGDLSHALESLLTAIAHGEIPADDDTLGLAQRTLDTLSGQIEAVAGGAPIHRARDLIQALALAHEEGLAKMGASVSEPPAPAPMPEPPPPRAAGPEAPAPSVAGPVEPAAQIRVRADLLNRLINDAGEISIYRSRLAQQSAVQGFRLAELGQTVERLREQLRHMEIETEAQILHRFERDSDARGSDRDDFDPLELDRFSTLQQLSRSLAETVNDLVSLRVLLADLQSESDTLLLQQARIVNDLQDGLLRTRMVPFAQIVPRLQRLVRQTAQQLGKAARLEVIGPEVELDRGIQERILAPMEHLLRNALAHGIEPPGRRAAAGKPATGLVSLALSREGNDVIIRVADDGSGLDLQAIRRRAVQRGLLVEGAPISDDELAQLVLESGFSTVEEVTQIAGRGVGLDVVNAEIKQLSGSFKLESQPGQGTSFTIRLPLTLAIIEVLLVDVAGEVMAIPHATIEAVARISREDLAACYRGEGTDFSYAGNSYRILYLGSTLQLSGTPELGERRWVPVILARAGDQRVAFHVDQLRGSQRIVVKPLGPQLSGIRWLSGGTILADGRVALILDPTALIRSGALHDYLPPPGQGEEGAERRACVMVVDDSLTVRRVTSRMLRRQDMEVITAQDGIEALTLLEERIPDVILLDIEMPRMDGYELTRHIRRSSRFQHIPIIMITSRTGEKHRRLALELGVNRYLGKPYQEAELLDEISSVLVEGAL